MWVVVVFNTKGGVGKTTLIANLGGLAADAGLRVLMLDLDTQPTLSSYYELVRQASSGTYELLANNERNLERLISQTQIPGLDLIVSNDPFGQLNTLLMHAPDGRLRLRPHKPLSENTVNKALRTMGYDTQSEICGHGFRTMACSALVESGLWSETAIERQMSHRERNSVRAAYIHKAEFIEERRLIMNWWSDYLEANHDEHFSPREFAGRR